MIRSKLVICIVVLIVIPLISCEQKKISDNNIIFLHHSTGGVIWYGNEISLITKVANKLSRRLTNIGTKALLPSLFKDYNKEYNKNYTVKEISFPKAKPYGWNNYPFDYYNIWVKNASQQPFLEEPSLEMLTKDYRVIIFKHCFPVSNILPDQDSADVNSDLKTVSNYQLQYLALKDKFHEFPDTKFIVCTGAAQVKSSITEDEAKRAKEFFKWVKNEWDIPNDNIYIWDLYELQTEGSLYFIDKYSESPGNSHPNTAFARELGNLLFNRIIDIIETDGTKTDLTCEKQ